MTILPDTGAAIAKAENAPPAPFSPSFSGTRPGLTETWQAEQRAFAARDLSQVDYVYPWADGIQNGAAP